VASAEAEALAADLGAQLRSLLRPDMTAVVVGEGGAGVVPLMAELVGPSGRVVAVEPGGLEDALAERVDLVLAGTRASEHAALRDVRLLLERRRPILLARFSPQDLRMDGTDPVSVLDRHRTIGLRASGAGLELPEDPGELVQAVDAGAAPVTLRLEWVDPPAPAPERLMPADRRLGRTWARRFPAAVEPGTLGYDATHRALVGSLLDDPDWGALFSGGAPLPPGLGAGFDERVVEYPWLFSRGLSGRVLDAGSVLNHRHLVERLLPAVEDLTIVTLAPEPTAHTSLGVSHLYGDLRTLPLRDGWFDEVVCLSTLEHVGMDNAVYGAAAPRAQDPQAEAVKALRELLRVVRPGGRIHISVPFGRREDHGWHRQLNRKDVDGLLAAAGAASHEETVFRHTRSGWRRSSSRRASRARYHPGAKRARDGAVAARAVLCATVYR
jgi:SAM-dependent methyltransferase